MVQMGTVVAMLVLLPGCGLFGIGKSKAKPKKVKKQAPVSHVTPAPTPAPTPQPEPQPTPSNGGADLPPGIDPIIDPAPTPAPVPKSYPTAMAVPGKTGRVLSPYNNREIDVEGIASGKLVADPTYPASEKKYFYVP